MQSGQIRNSLPRIFAWPMVFAALSTFGLVSALLGDDVWDWLSWLTLGLPVVVIAWFWGVRARARRLARDGERFADQIAVKG